MISPESELNIVAIGGGTPRGKAQQFLKHAVEMSGVERKPQVLLISTSKVTPEKFEASIAAGMGSFGEDMGLPTTSLHDFRSIPAKAELEEKIEAADVVYISGGDSDYAMGVWREHGIDTMLKKRAHEGMPLSGISFGAIAPFDWGHSDSMQFRVPEGDHWDYWAVDGLGLVKASITPHYNTFPNDESRALNYHQMLLDRQYTGEAYGIDNGAALIIESGAMRVANVIMNRTAHLILTNLEEGTVAVNPLEATSF